MYIPTGELYMTRERLYCHVTNSEYRNQGEIFFEKRDQWIWQIQEESGGSIRQLSRVLGLGEMMVEQILKP